MMFKYFLGTVEIDDLEVPIYLKYNFSNGIFTMTAHIGCIKFGQCIEEAIGYFPNDQKALNLFEIWKKYHLKEIPINVQQSVEKLL